MSGPGVTGAADSAGVPFAGRAFSSAPPSTDDGSAPPELLAVLQAFHAGSATRSAVIEVLRTVRLLAPLLAERGDEGVGAHGQMVDKTQELSIVTVEAPDGRRVLPAFSSVTALGAWNPAARPIPVEARRVALAAAGEGTELVVLDPKSDTEFGIRRPALQSLALGTPWVSPIDDATVTAAFDASISEDSDVLAIRIVDGDPDARLTAPEVLAIIAVSSAVEPGAVEELVARLSARWAADATITERVDSIGVRVVPT